MKNLKDLGSLFHFKLLESRKFLELFLRFYLKDTTEIRKLIDFYLRVCCLLDVFTRSI